MGKRVRKVPPARLEPITFGQLEEAARSLVDRGLATESILLGRPRPQREWRHRG